MVNIAQLEQALINADSAGDTEAATVLAQEIQKIAFNQQNQPKPFDEEARTEELYQFGLQQGALQPKTFANYASEIPKGLLGGAANLYEQAALGVATALPESYEAPVREGILATGDFIERNVTEADLNMQDSVPRKFSDALGSFAGIIPAYILGGPYGAGALTGFAGAGEASERAREAGATQEERNLAALGGAAIGLTEAIPIARIFSKLPPGAKSTILDRGKRVLEATGVEGLQEFAANLGQNFIEKGIYNPEQELLEGAGEAAGYGGGVGGFVASFMELFIPGKRRRSTTQTDPTDATDEILAISGPDTPLGLPAPPQQITGPGTPAVVRVDSKGKAQTSEELSTERTKAMETAERARQEILRTGAVSSKTMQDLRNANIPLESVSKVLEETKELGAEAKFNLEPIVVKEEADLKSPEKPPLQLEKPIVYVDAEGEAKTERNITDEVNDKKATTGASFDTPSPEILAQYETALENAVQIKDAKQRQAAIAKLKKEIDNVDVFEAIYSKNKSDIPPFILKEIEGAEDADPGRADATRSRDGVPSSRQKDTSAKRVTTPKETGVVRLDASVRLVDDTKIDGAATLRKVKPVLTGVGSAVAPEDGARGPAPKIPLAFEAKGKESDPVDIAKEQATYKKAVSPINAELKTTKAQIDKIKNKALISKKDTEVLTELATRRRGLNKQKNKLLNNLKFIKGQEQTSSVQPQRRALTPADDTLDLNIRSKHQETLNKDKELTDYYEKNKELGEFKGAVSKTNRAMFGGQSPLSLEDKRSIRRLVSVSDVNLTTVEKDVKNYLLKNPDPMSSINNMSQEIGVSEPEFKTTQEENLSKGEVKYRTKTGGRFSQNVRDWVEENLSENTNRWVENEIQYYEDGVPLTQDFIEKNLQLPDSDVVSVDTPLTPRAIEFLKQGDLQGALNAIAASSSSKRLTNLANMLAKNLGTTKISIVDNLGKKRSGIFDPQTNTIKLNKDTGLNTHTVLHELVHAVTSANLAKASHPTTKQLNTLFNNVKDSLSSARGSKNLDEFVAEAMSNPEFQAELASINVQGETLPAWRKFQNIIMNFIRGKLGLQTKPLDSLSSIDAMIEAVIAPAPGYRFAGELELSAPDILKSLGNMQKNIPKVTPQFRQDFVNSSIDFLATAGKSSKVIFTKLTGSQALGEIAKGIGLGELGFDVNKTILDQRGAMNIEDKKIKDILLKIQRWTLDAGKDKTDALNRVIYDQNYGATIYQVDPSKPQSFYKTKKGDPVFDNDGNNLLEVWNNQQKDWKAIGSGGRATFDLMRKTYKDYYIKLKEMIYKRIDDALTKDPKAATKLKKTVYEKMFDSNTLDVYFPLVRSGKFMLAYTIKSDAKVKSINSDDSLTPEEKTEAIKNIKAGGYVVRTFNSRRERKLVREELEAQGDILDNSMEEQDGDFEFKKLRRPPPPESFVASTLDLLAKSGVKTDVQNDVMALFIATLPETSFAKSLQGRKNTTGYMNDSVYAFRSKAFDLARSVVRLEYSGKLRDIETKLRDTNLKAPAAQTSFKGIKGVGDARDYTFEQLAPGFDQVQNELLRRSQFARQGSEWKKLEPYAKRLNQIAFIYTIGFNPSSAIVNLSQLPLFISPYLSAEYGMVPTNTEIAKASRLIGSLTGIQSLDSNFDIDEQGNYTVTESIKLTPKQRSLLDADEIKKVDERVKDLEELIPLVKLATQRHQLGDSQLKDAMGLDESGREVGGNVAGRILDKVSSVSAIWFNTAERFNRQVTLVTAYKLELNKLKKDNMTASELAKAKETAAEVSLFQTQQLNGGAVLETAPGWAQQGFGRVALMYKSYGLQMYYTMFKSAKKLLDKNDPNLTPEQNKEVRKIAMKQLVAVQGAALILAGVQGMPLYGLYRMIAGLFLYFDDENDDTVDTLVRKQLGEGWYKGPLVASLGMDVAERIRLNRLLIQENRFNRDASTEELIGFHLGGPALSTGKRWIRGIQHLGEGETSKGIESFLPAGIANFIKVNPIAGGRYYDDGGKLTSRGDMVYKFTSSDYFKQGLGFQPAELSRTQQIVGAEKYKFDNITKSRSKLTKRYYMASRRFDVDEMLDIKAEILKFNQKHPTFPIDTKTLKKSMKRHAETSKSMIAGVSFPKMMEKEYRASLLEYDDLWMF